MYHWHIRIVYIAITEYQIRTDLEYWKCIPSLWQVSQKSSIHHDLLATDMQYHALIAPLFEVIWYDGDLVADTLQHRRIWVYYVSILHPTRRPNQTLVYPHEPIWKKSYFIFEEKIVMKWIFYLLVISMPLCPEEAGIVHPEQSWVILR